MNFLKLVGTVGLILASSGNALPKSAVPHDFKLSLERQACYGFCPMYKVSVDSNGLVTYVGERFVKLKGTHKAQLGKSQLERLWTALERANLSQYNNFYKKMSVTDLPSAIIQFRGKRRSKSIDHYHGDKSAPESLTRLENELDSLIGTRKWVGTGIYRK